jgi:hypothetical protein
LGQRTHYQAGGSHDQHAEQEILAQEERLTLATRQLISMSDSTTNDIMFTVTGATRDKSSLMDEARRGSPSQAAAETKHFESFEKEDIRVVTATPL